MSPPASPPRGSTRRLVTADGVRLAAEHLPPAPGVEPRGGDLCFVVAHGFAGGWHKPAVRRLAARLSLHGGVVGFDFRGHGGSGGRSTVGHREPLDLEAAVRWARALGYRRVVTVGWSMGAAVTIRHAALHRSVDAAVAVSGPARWFYRGTPPMRRAHWAFGRPHGRAVLRAVLRTRVARRSWDESRPDSWPLAPWEVVARVAPVPLLVVHGDRDPFFPLDHAEQLAAAAGGGGAFTLWVEPGFGHAEGAATPELVDRIADWAARASAAPRDAAGAPGAGAAP